MAISQAELKDELHYLKSLINKYGLNEENTEKAHKLVRTIIDALGYIPEDILENLTARKMGLISWGVGKGLEIWDNSPFGGLDLTKAEPTLKEITELVAISIEAQRDKTSYDRFLSTS
jgi:broad-specificity NMP kinase